MFVRFQCVLLFCQGVFCFSEFVLRLSGFRVEGWEPSRPTLEPPSLKDLITGLGTLAKILILVVSSELYSSTQNLTPISKYL